MFMYNYMLVFMYLLDGQFIFLVVIGVFFFFKQKTAYEMRISDWSSDVCSSDLHRFVSAPVKLILRSICIEIQITEFDHHLALDGDPYSVREDRGHKGFCKILGTVEFAFVDQGIDKRFGFGFERFLPLPDRRRRHDPFEARANIVMIG